ncbi:hypothetical protein AC1031_018218 [Aphanomyces cochlioides]|nr:hypothetical protein AC1031_018218 [Aphanomyces cochlioides]
MDVTLEAAVDEPVLGAAYIHSLDQAVVICQSHIRRRRISTPGAEWAILTAPWSNEKQSAQVQWSESKDIAVLCNVEQTQCTIIDTMTLKSFQVELPDASSRMECVAVSKEASYIVCRSLHHVHIFIRLTGMWLPPMKTKHAQSSYEWHAVTQSKVMGSMLLVGTVEPLTDVIRCTTEYIDLDSQRAVAVKTKTFPLPPSSKDIQFHFNAQLQALAIQTTSGVTVYQLHSQSIHIYDTPGVICTWNGRSLLLYSPRGMLQVIDARTGATLYEFELKIKEAKPTHLSSTGPCLLIQTLDKLHVCKLSLPSQSPPQLVLQKAKPSTTLCFVRQRHPISLPPLVKHFLRSDASVSSRYLFTQYSLLAKLCTAARREDLLFKLTALTMHGLHSAWPHPMRYLLNLLLRSVQPWMVSSLNTFGGILKDSPQTIPTHLLPRFCALIQSVRAPSFAPVPPWVPQLQVLYGGIFMAAELESWVPVLQVYDVQTLFQRVDQAQVRRDARDLRFLALVSIVMTMSLVHLTPFIPILPLSSSGLWNLTPLSLWHLLHHPQWTLSTAVQLGHISKTLPFLLALCLEFTTPFTDEFITAVCRQYPADYVDLVGRLRLSQVLHIYAVLPLLPIEPRAKRFDSPIQGRKDQSGLYHSRFYRMIKSVAIPPTRSSLEATASQFTVAALRQIKRIVEITFPKASLLAGLSSLAPSLAQLELAYLIDPEGPWYYAGNASSQAVKPLENLFRLLAKVTWSCVVRDLAAASNGKESGVVSTREASWNIVRLSAASIFGKSATDIRLAQLQSVNVQFTSSPEDAATAFAFLQSWLPQQTSKVVSKRTMALVAECKMKLGATWLDDKQAWLNSRSIVDWDPLFWTFCVALGFESESVKSKRPIKAIDNRVELPTRLDAQNVSEKSEKITTGTQSSEPKLGGLYLLNPRRTQSSTDLKKPNGGANVLKLLQMQKAQIVASSSSSSMKSQSEKKSNPRAEALQMPAAIKPLGFHSNEETSDRVRLKLLRQCSSMANVSLRTRDFMAELTNPQPSSSSREVLVRSGVAQTEEVIPATLSPSVTASVPETHSAATMTIPIPTTDSFVETDFQTVETTTQMTQADNVLPPVPVVAPFPIYVDIHQRKTPFLHVAEVDMNETSTRPSPPVFLAPVQRPKDKPLRPADNDIGASPDVAVDDPFRQAYDAILPEEVKDVTLQRRQSRHSVAIPSVASSKLVSMQSQMEVMRKQLERIESFADAIENDFTESHKLLEDMQARTRGMSGLVERNFSSRLHALEATHTGLQRAIDTTKSKMQVVPVSTGGSNLTTKAAADMQDAKNLLQQLEATLRHN